MAMNPISIIGDSERLISGAFYLPAIGFGLLFLRQMSQPSLFIPIAEATYNLYQIGMIISVISAVILQEFYESVTGPSSQPSNLINKDTLVQRINYTIYGVGSPSDYPSSYRTPIWEVDLEIPVRRQFALIIYVGSFIVIILSYPYVIWRSTEFAIVNEDLIAGAIALMMVVYALKVLASGIWPNTYTADSYEQPSINRRLEEFARHIYDFSLIEPKDGGYSSEGGGTFSFSYETKARTPLQELAIIEGLLVGVAGTVAAGDFPCKEFRFSVQRDGNEVAKYTLDSESVHKFRHSSVEMGYLLDEVLDAVEYTDGSD